MSNKLLNIFSQEEITISDLWVVLKISLKRSLLISIGILIIFFIYALLDYNSREVEYRAEANVRIEGFEKVNSNLQGLSSLFDNKIQSSEGNILGPEMFGEIINSKAFLNDLVISKIPVNDNGSDSITLESYFYNLPNLSKLEKIKTIFFKSTPKQYKKKEIDLAYEENNLKIIKDQINPDILFSQTVPPIVSLKGTRADAISAMQNRIEYKFTEGKASVYVKMPEPFLSAVATKLVLEKLIDYVKKYKTKKQTDNLVYVEEKYNEAQLKYKAAQLKYAGYKDASLGVILQSAQSNEQILSNNSTVLFNILNQFALQLEQARFELKKETPMFFILEPISIPSIKYEPLFSKILLKTMAIAMLIVFIIIIINLFIIKNE
jgi:hypothetical protein